MVSRCMMIKGYWDSEEFDRGEVGGVETAFPTPFWQASGGVIGLDAECGSGGFLPVINTRKDKYVPTLIRYWDKVILSVYTTILPLAIAVDEPPCFSRSLGRRQWSVQ